MAFRRNAPVARLYPALLVIATALAVAACLHPNAAEELMTLVGAFRGGGEKEASAAPPSPPAASEPITFPWQAEPTVITPSQLGPGSEPIPEPGDVGESVISDGVGAQPSSQLPYRPSMQPASPPLVMSPARPAMGPLEPSRALQGMGPPQAARPSYAPESFARPLDPLGLGLTGTPPLPQAGSPSESSIGAGTGGLAVPKDQPEHRFSSPTTQAMTPVSPVFADPTVRLATPTGKQSGPPPPRISVLPYAPAPPPGEPTDPDASDNEKVVRLPRTDTSVTWKNPDQVFDPPPIPDAELGKSAGLSRPDGPSEVQRAESAGQAADAPLVAFLPPQPETVAQQPPSENPPGFDREPPEGSQLEIKSPVVAEVKPCESAQILARVGSDVILAGEVSPAVNEILQPYQDKVPPSQLEAQREALVRRLLEQQIEMKRIYLDAKGTIPAEGLRKFEEEIGKQFDEKELPELLKRSGMTSRTELEKHLDGLGTSLDRHKRAFVERAIASTWMYQQTKREDDITHEEMLAYYEKNLESYKKPAKARWEELCVSFKRQPDKPQAYDLISQMGNQVIDGADFSEVARERSEGVTAPKGGAWDWTGRNALVSRSLDEALFTLPVGQLSPIIEDEEGLHIIRVTERHDEGVTPFGNAQVEIKEKISDERKTQRLAAFNERLKRQIPASTVFDQSSGPPAVGSGL